VVVVVVLVPLVVVVGMIQLRFPARAGLVFTLP
jgi:hypothetical protein